MSDVNARYRLPVRVTIVALVLALFASLAVPVAAQADDPMVEYLGPEPEIWEGPWAGMIFAGGDGVLVAQGIEFVYQLDISGSLSLEASDEVVIGEFSVEGEYSMLGEQGNSTLVGVFDTVGNGEIIGTPTDLVMTGSAESDGIVEVTAGGNTQAVPAGSPNDLRFGIELEAAICNEVYGSFEADLEARFEEIGWNPQMEGNVIFVQDPAIIQASLEDWTDGFTGFPDLSSSSDFPPGTPDIVRVFDSVARRYNSWADYVNGSNPDLATGAESWTLTKELITDVQHLYARVRNLSECEIKLLGDLHDKYLVFLTRAVLQVIIRIGAVKTDLTGKQLFQLTAMALSVGAFGGGSLAPADAATAEAALQDAAARILDPYVLLDDPDCDGACIAMTQEAIQVLTVAAQMGWDLVVKDSTINANYLLSQLGLGITIGEFIPLLQAESP